MFNKQLSIINFLSPIFQVVKINPVLYDFYFCAKVSFYFDVLNNTYMNLCSTPPKSYPQGEDFSYSGYCNTDI
jgi:hypothetical protein